MPRSAVGNVYIDILACDRFGVARMLSSILPALPACVRMDTHKDVKIMNNIATTDDLPCKKKSCMSDGTPEIPVDPERRACSPMVPGKTLKGILKEKIRTWVIEKGIIAISVGLIIYVMYFWLGLNR
jgi:hypothetical protein